MLWLEPSVSDIPVYGVTTPGVLGTATPYPSSASSLATGSNSPPAPSPRASGAPQSRSAWLPELPQTARRCPRSSAPAALGDQLLQQREKPRPLAARGDLAGRVELHQSRIGVRRPILTPQFKVTSIGYRADRRATHTPNNSQGGHCDDRSQDGPHVVFLSMCRRAAAGAGPVLQPDASDDCRPPLDPSPTRTPFRQGRCSH